ncbi:MAG: ribonuclease P protein component [Rikenellaceae bacterium]|nr:ribonuclease P protein component [Rikenellaceae bacterium]
MTLSHINETEILPPCEVLEALCEEVVLRNTLTKSEIMRTPAVIDSLFAKGRRGTVAPIRYVWQVTRGTEQTDTCGVGIMFSVPKKFFKRANKRNLLRRRMKECYRQAKHDLVREATQKGITLNIALIYTSKEISDYNTINNVVCRILEQIRERL